MTLREMFKKVEAYNEIAALMRTEEAKINLVECDGCYFGETFSDYKSLTRYVKTEFIKELADLVLKCDQYEFDKEVNFRWTDIFGDVHDVTFAAELVA